MDRAIDFYEKHRNNLNQVELMEAWQQYVFDNSSTDLVSLEGVTRLEVIDKNGRAYINWNAGNRFEISFQDNRRTLKIFNSRK